MKKAMMITVLGVALIGMSSFVQAGEIKVQAEAAEEEAKGEVKAKVEEVKGKLKGGYEHAKENVKEMKAKTEAYPITVFCDGLEV